MIACATPACANGSKKAAARSPRPAARVNAKTVAGSTLAPKTETAACPAQAVTASASPCPSAVRGGSA